MHEANFLEKRRLYQRTYYAQNRERLIKMMRDRRVKLRTDFPEKYRIKIKEEYKKYGPRYAEIKKEYHRKWREKLEKDPERLKQYLAHQNDNAKKYSQRLRLLALSEYSKGTMKCHCCGEANVRFLTLGHKNASGKKHRKQTRGMNMYRWLQSHKYPEGLLNVECYNCNLGRSANNDICPHITNKLKDNYGSS